jgi:hypothetical protein
MGESPPTEKRLLAYSSMRFFSRLETKDAMKNIEIIVEAAILAAIFAPIFYLGWQIVGVHQ